MLVLNEVVAAEAAPLDVALHVTLAFHLRARTRQRLQLSDGREAALYLPRGTIIRGGECLRSEAGLVVRVQAAPEWVSRVHCKDERRLLQAAYHLGNRHVALAIGPHQLTYLQDSVLDAMVEHLGLQVTHESAPFEPEAGAYGMLPSQEHHHHAEGPHVHD